MTILDRLRHNLGLKLASLIVALAIWGTVHNEANPLVMRQQVVRVEARNVPEALAVAVIEPTQVSATLYGRRAVLERLEYSDFRMVADMSGANIGSVSVPLKPQALPTGIEIRHLSNRMAKVTLDAVVTRTRSLYVQTRGEPAPGVMVTGSQVRQQEVSVSGPSTEVRKVLRVLAPVDVSGRNQTTPVTVDLLPVDAGGLLVSGVKVQPPQAVVTVQMRQVNSRTVPVVPVISQIPAGYDVAAVVVRPVVVTIAGPANRLGAIESVQTAPLDLTSEPGKVQYTVALQAPAGIKVLGTSAVRVTVTLRQSNTETKAPAAAPPAPQPPVNAPPANKTGASPPEVAPPAPPQPDQPATSPGS